MKSSHKNRGRNETQTEKEKDKVQGRKNTKRGGEESAKEERRGEDLTGPG